VTADQWCAAHRKEIEKIGRWLLRRWPVPAAVTADDVAQELRLGAVLALRDYDPARGVPLDRYVWWQAMQRTKRWLHVQRGALRRSGSAPSTHPVLTTADPDEWRDVRSDGMAQDEVVEFLELLRQALAACRTPQERTCFGALVDARFDVEVAGAALFESAECDARTPRQARRMVRECVQRLTEVQA
jgi:hypothetical protein